jgi:hypothetical protein
VRMALDLLGTVVTVEFPRALQLWSFRCRMGRGQQNWLTRLLVSFPTGMLPPIEIFSLLQNSEMNLSHGFTQSIMGKYPQLQLCRMP